MARPFKICPDCGAHLDASEPCDCKDAIEREPPKPWERLKLLAVCREVDKESGRVSVYPLDGGRSIVFEAKYTTTDRLKWDVLTQEQRDTLERHARRGALAAVCGGIGNEFFFVPWAVWRDMKEHFGRKYVTAADLEQWRVRFNGAVLFLDYVHHERSGTP